MSVKSYKDLVVWQQSMELVKQIYNLTALLPKSEQFGLTNQLTRCAVSIPSNIAEGQQRQNLKEYRQFLGIAKGSAGELETQLLIVKDIYSIDISEGLKKLHSIQKMLFSLSKRLEPITQNL